jgi:hypothetical protein
LPVRQWAPGEEARPSAQFASQAHRVQNVETEVPGPGRYSPRIIDGGHRVPQLIHETRFAACGSWIDTTKQDIPSPDTYQQVRIEPGRGRTISRISRDVPIAESPGPGHYDVVHGSLFKRSKNAAAPQAVDP